MKARNIYGPIEKAAYCEGVAFVLELLRERDVEPLEAYVLAARDAAEQARSRP